MTQKEKEYCEKCPIHDACAYIRINREDLCVTLASFVDGFDEAIEKATKWLKENHHKYTSWDTIEYELNFNTDTLIEDLKKDMEE